MDKINMLLDLKKVVHGVKRVANLLSEEGVAGTHKSKTITENFSVDSSIGGDKPKIQITMLDNGFIKKVKFDGVNCSEQAYSYIEWLISLEQ